MRDLTFVLMLFAASFITVC
uniref:Uncharacterized protein n=1 Tax=Anguilla anguilla TaxID=7936 RepID=A0A0E9PQR0_ANGAN